MELNSTLEIIQEIQQGKMVILMDDEDRENEGDLIIAAENITPEIINFMARHACGLICLTLTADRCEQLRLPLMVQDNNAQHSTNFTVSIEAAKGVTTGISAADRAVTVQAAVAADAKPSDIVQPGHIFPLMASPGGVLSRAGHTEAGCDLADLAGLEPAAVIVEIMNQDGTMARRPDLEKFAKQHDLKIGTISDLIHYRILHEKTVVRIGEQPIDTPYGEFKLVIYQDKTQHAIHYALIKGEISTDCEPLVRISQLETFRDVIGAQLSDRKSWSLPASLKHIAEDKEGVLVILAGHHPSIDLINLGDSDNKILTQCPLTTLPGRSFQNTVGTGSQILRDLGVRKMRLMSPPIKYTGLSGFDLEVVEYINPP